MSEFEQHEPGTVRLARASQKEIGQLAAAVVAISDGVRADLAAIAVALEVELPDRADPEAIAWARQRANADDRVAAVEATRRQMQEAHAAARRQLGAPPNTRRDGSRPKDLELDPREKAAFLAQRGLSQAARHAAMAQTYAPSADDAHRDTRAIRESIYAKLAQEGNTHAS